MSRTARTKGGPPKTLTGRMPASSMDSPWWDGVVSEIISRPGMVGRTMTIEELTQIVPSYTGGTRPRARTVARRLLPILELVSRGPNGSRGKGAVYRIKAPPHPIEASEARIVDDEVEIDMDWITNAIDRMTSS